ncbi:MAG: CoA-binding protein [Candidatus Helarchaeota archaeon]|nr:CoA-binding protein [Candidatus Helarchaeota archaeon]
MEKVEKEKQVAADDQRAKEGSIKTEFFFPKSVAIVGVTPSNGWFWLKNMMSLDYAGKIFPINPKYESALGLKFYDRVANVPYDIDYVLISVPAHHVKNVLQECILKKVKLVTIFTSGFSELGTAEGRLLEQELLDLKRNTKSDIRILGPNCLGVYCPESGLSFRPEFSKNTGHIGFLSQSGGLAINMGLRGRTLKMFFSKVVSFGNAADVQPSELLEYLGTYDERTRIIGMYLEGIKNGPEFLRILKEITLKKPVVILKGGQTSEGARAAASHTGAIAAANELWNSMYRQSGAVAVNSFEELVDTLLLFNHCNKLPKSNNIGLLSVSGGSSVINTDAAAKLGLNIPKLSPESITKLQDIVQEVGTSVSNPLDLAASFFNIQALKAAIETLGEDPVIDSLIIEIANHYIYTPESQGVEGFAELFYQTVLRLLKKIIRSGKPVLVVFPTIAYEQRRIWDQKLFIDEKIPTFSSFLAAAQALSHLVEYAKYLENK